MRSVLVIAVLLFSAIGVQNTNAEATPFASLDQPSQTATIRRDGIELIAFYNKHDSVLDLTILITDEDGEALRTRVGLRDRQHHTLLLTPIDKTRDVTQIEFLRVGERVEMIVSDRPNGLEYSTIGNANQF